MNELQPGMLLRGKYRVERVIGMGGMGVVLRATHLRLLQRVAIKALRPEAKHRTTAVKRRFAREARAASRLRGEHAVRILDVDDSESGDPFLVMEYLEGQDLRQLLYAEGALPVTRAVDYVLQACEAIAEAHAAGIIHRDLKPANLFLTTRPDGTALIKILDFGISKTNAIASHKGGGQGGQEDHAGRGARGEEDDGLLTKRDRLIGTPSYMSPEQITNAADVDVRTDVWGLGVVLYQLLSDALPFDASSGASLIARIADDDPPPPLREHRSDVPEELAAVIHRCLSKDRNERYADVALLARALAPFKSSRPERESGADRVARVIATAATRAPPVAKSVSVLGVLDPDDVFDEMSSLDAPHRVDGDPFTYSHTSLAEDTPLAHTLERAVLGRSLPRPTHALTCSTRARSWRSWVVIATGLAERLARRIT